MQGEDISKVSKVCVCVCVYVCVRDIDCEHAGLYHSFRQLSISHFSHLSNVVCLAGRNQWESIILSPTLISVGQSGSQCPDSDQLNAEIQSLLSNTVQGEWTEIGILNC